MKQILIFFNFLFMVIYICHESEASYTNFKVKSFDVCNRTQLQVKFYGQVTHEKDKQYLNSNITFPYPIGDNIGMSFLIETKNVGNNFIELFTVREKNLCKAFNKYFGEFWYDIQRQSLMTPGVCPMQQGRYQAHHIELHFERVTLQTFPFGTLRFTMKGIDNANKNTVWCFVTEVDNVIN